VAEDADDLAGNTLRNDGATIKKTIFHICKIPNGYQSTPIIFQAFVT
jgi:hypothetical protein